MSILIAYEDHYYLALDKALRRVLKRGSPLTIPREHVPVDGVTNFRGFVATKWPLFQDKGFPTGGKRTMQALVCVADADKIAQQLSLTAAPSQGSTKSWVNAVEQEFTAFLRRETDQPDRVHGVVLRWSLESALIAGFDSPDAMKPLAGLALVQPNAFESFLNSCEPNPRTGKDEDFVDTYRFPQRCLKQMEKSLGWRPLKKGDRRKDDALKWLVDHDLDRLVRRVPDLNRIAERIRTIAGGL